MTVRGKLKAHKSIVQDVTASPCSKQAWGFLSFCLQSKYALLGLEHANEICFATARSTAVVGGGELSCCDIVPSTTACVNVSNGAFSRCDVLM